MHSRTRMALLVTTAAGLIFVGGSRALDAKSDVDWKAILPESELTKLVDDSIKTLKEATQSSTTFNLKAKNAEGEAYVLLLYAQAGINSGNEELAKKSTALQDAAIKLADAASKKNLDESKKQVALIADFKNMKPAGSSQTVALKEAIPIEKLMEQVNVLDKKMEGTGKSYKRLRPAEWSAKGKTEEIAMNSHKMAALTVAIAAHVPEMDEKEKTKKHWLDSTAEVRAATLEMAAAAKAKKQNEFKDALNKMAGACTKCHDVFRDGE